ncbi:YceD family protein [Kozakia baliensis]|uniref:YceD family protein n=1 Tax=Kozakia baliensis TaxID=153496 RepID=UPI00089DB52F|nr:DUF177 domain-containing protein [Kozakia baliensis]GBR24825.1 hypothetical protein AA0488_0484 [Kozakia baliensis NRIC 0488]GEL63821.1 metal-binding protein [Kozakia baliensis]
MSNQPEFSRRIALHRLGREPFTEVLEATPKECAALAKRLLLPAIASLTCRYRLTLGEGETIFAEGWLSAEVTQICVVTDEAFDDVITENFTLRLVPENRFSEERALELDEIDELPYEGHNIDLGEITSEQLALALPAYPRRAGAALEHGVDEVPREETEAEEAAPRPNPFAALATLAGQKNAKEEE